MFMICVWWFVSAHKWFKGPKVNVEHMMVGRDVEGMTIEGQDLQASSIDSDNISGKAAEAAANSHPNKGIDM